jgi:histone H3/H4
MAELPLAPFERILKKAGAKRVSHSALQEFALVMEDKMYKIAKEAALLAKHAGRKTITDEDVRIAKRKVSS